MTTNFRFKDPGGELLHELRILKGQLRCDTNNDLMEALVAIARDKLSKEL